MLNFNITEHGKLHTCGKFCFDNGNYVEAVKYYNQSIRIYPHPVYLCMRGNSHYLMKNYEMAIPDYNKVEKKFKSGFVDHRGKLTKETVFFDAVCNRGACYFCTNRIVEAERDFDIVLSSRSFFSVQMTQVYMKSFVGKVNCIDRNGYHLLREDKLDESERKFRSIIQVILNLPQNVPIHFYPEIIKFFEMTRQRIAVTKIRRSEIVDAWRFSNHIPSANVPSRTCFPPHVADIFVGLEGEVGLQDMRNLSLFEGLTSSLEGKRFQEYVRKSIELEEDCVSFLEQGYHIHKDKEIMREISTRSQSLSTFSFHNSEYRDSSYYLSKKIECLGKEFDHPIDFVQYIREEIDLCSKLQVEAIERRWKLSKNFQLVRTIGEELDFQFPSSIVFSISEALKFRAESYSYEGYADKYVQDLVDSMVIDLLFLKVFSRVGVFKHPMNKDLPGMWRRLSTEKTSVLEMNNLRIVAETLRSEPIDEDILSGWYYSELDYYYGLRIDCNPMCIVNYVRRFNTRIQLFDLIGAYEDMRLVRILSKIEPKLQNEYLSVCGMKKSNEETCGEFRMRIEEKLFSREVLKNVEALKMIEEKKFLNVVYPTFPKDTRSDVVNLTEGKFEWTEYNVLRNDLEGKFKEMISAKEFEKSVMWILGSGAFAVCLLFFIPRYGFFVAKIYKYMEHINKKMKQRDSIQIPYHRNIAPVIFTTETTFRTCRFRDSVRRIFETRYSKISGFLSSSVMLMKYYRMSLGGYLHKRLERNQPLSVLEVCRIIRGLLEGVCHLHVNKLVHRDLHLSNIMIDPNYGRLWICDFGCCLNLKKRSDFKVGKDEDILQEYSSSSYMNVGGSKVFLPPEIVEKENVSVLDYEKCDIFSVGVITYVLLEGRLKDMISDEGKVQKFVQFAPFGFIGSETRVKGRKQFHYVGVKGCDSEIANFVEQLLLVDKMKRLDCDKALYRLKKIHHRMEYASQKMRDFQAGKEGVHEFSDSFVTHKSLSSDRNVRMKQLERAVERKKQRQEKESFHRLNDVKSTVLRLQSGLEKIGHKKFPNPENMTFQEQKLKDILNSAIAETEEYVYNPKKLSPKQILDFALEEHRGSGSSGISEKQEEEVEGETEVEEIITIALKRSFSSVETERQFQRSSMFVTLRMWALEQRSSEENSHDMNRLVFSEGLSMKILNPFEESDDSKTLEEMDIIKNGTLIWCN